MVHIEEFDPKRLADYPGTATITISLMGRIAESEVQDWHPQTLKAVYEKCKDSMRFGVSWSLR